MKLKSKLVAAAAAVLAVTGTANAALIDWGTDGSGDFFFNIWDENTSYTANLNFQQSAFTSAVAAPGLYSFTRALTSDPVFNAFLATAVPSQFQWNVVAVESMGGRTLHQSYTPGTLPAQAQTASNGRSLVDVTQTYIGRVNDEMMAQAPGPLPGETTGNSIRITGTALPTWAGNLGCNLTAATQGFSNCGTQANNSLATGLGLVIETYAGTGTGRGVFTPSMDSGMPLRVYLDSGYNLQIAAVPEPQTYAMLLAGLGLMGAFARRRQQNKA